MLKIRWYDLWYMMRRHNLQLLSENIRFINLGMVRSPSPYLTRVKVTHKCYVPLLSIFYTAYSYLSSDAMQAHGSRNV